MTTLDKINITFRFSSCTSNKILILSNTFWFEHSKTKGKILILSNTFGLTILRQKVRARSDAGLLKHFYQNLKFLKQLL